MANFPELSIDRIGSKVLTVSAPGLVAAGSEAFTISPAAACQLAFIQSPTDAVAGVTISPAVVVQVEDAFSNPVATSGVPVSLTISTGLGTLDGTTLQSTDSGGIATFGDLQIAAAGVKQLTAARDGLIPVVSSLFTIAPGDYTRVQLLVPGEIAAAGTATGKSGSPTAQIAGTAFTVRVNAVDAFWNIINTVSNTVDIYSSDAGAVLPANASLVAGTNTFNITLNTVGTQSITAEDFVDATIADDTSPDILVATTLRTLRVTSAHGTAVPAPGAYTTVAGAVLTNSVTSPDTQGSTQYVCTGWVMTGNEPFSGTGNQFVMTITNDSSLTWLWATNYWLGVTAGPNGSVMGATNGWYGLGAPITVTAAASPYYHLEGWSGDVQGDTNNAGMTLIMDRPRAVSAAFTATLAAGGTPYWWLAQYELIHDGLSYDAAETNDADKDGALNWEEYVADTDPTNSSSVLDAINVSNKSLTNTVFFASSSNRVYALMMATNLLGSQSWMDVVSVTNRGTGGILSLYDTNATGPRYYRVKVKLAP